MNDISFRILQVAYEWKEIRTDSWMLTSPVLLGSVFTNEQEAKTQFDWLVKVGFLEKTLKYYDYTHGIPWCISESGENEYVKEQKVRKRKGKIENVDYLKAKYWIVSDPIKEGIKVAIVAMITWFFTWLSLKTKPQFQAGKDTPNIQQSK